MAYFQIWGSFCVMVYRCWWKATSAFSGSTIWYSYPTTGFNCKNTFSSLLYPRLCPFLLVCQSTFGFILFDFCANLWHFSPSFCGLLFLLCAALSLGLLEYKPTCEVELPCRTNGIIICKLKPLGIIINSKSDSLSSDVEPYSPLWCELQGMTTF